MHLGTRLTAATIELAVLSTALTAQNLKPPPSEIPVRTLKGRLLLTIPAGTQNGRTFRLTGQGMPRLKGDGAGDLYLRVRVILPTNLSSEARAAAERFLDLAAQPDPRS